jgi:hypothetical protein
MEVISQARVPIVKLRFQNLQVGREEGREGGREEGTEGGASLRKTFHA